jgi:ATP-dependent RNA helicase DeaD
MLIFVRTKTSTAELAEKLEARGFATSALNGDIPQNQRERTVQQLKNGKIDIIVATDVAARGLDVPRISHVVNYDVPYDTESYVHRIGRTGRAGREGDAILFVAPREKRMLAAIERATRQKITRMELPSTEVINDKRVSTFKQRITDTLANEDLEFFTQLIEQYQQEHNIPANEIAAALAQLVQGDTPLLIQHKPHQKADKSWDDRDKMPTGGRDRKPRDFKQRDRGAEKQSATEAGMERYRIEVGHKHKVMPGNIVGAISGETGIDSKHIGRISIFDDYSFVDMPEGMPKEMLKQLKNAWVSGQQLNISRAGSGGGAGDRPPTKKFKHGTPKTAKRKKDRHKDRKSVGKKKFKKK